MCPPDYFDINYSINPWMDKSIKVNTNKEGQWQSLVNKFKELNVDLEFIQPQKNYPDMTYVDAGIIYKNVFIPSNFKHKERQGEKKYYIDWFKKNEFKILEISEKFYFEGHGDTLWVGKNLFFGHGFRSCLKAQDKIQDIFNTLDNTVNIVSVELTDPRFYHLDTCFCPINESQALYFPGAISKKSIEKLERKIGLIEVTEADAFRFACNSVVINNDIIIPAGTKTTCDALESIGYRTHQIEMDEFIKGGGACKCLSFPIKT